MNKIWKQAGHIYKTPKIGQIFKSTREDLYMLAHTEYNYVVLINIFGDPGKTWTFPFKVLNLDKITEYEFDQITTNEKFELSGIGIKEIEHQLIDDIIVTALEGGINYWADRCRILTYGDAKEGDPASTVVAKGGTITIREAETEKIYVLNRDMVLKGISKFIKEQKDFTDCADLDANDADLIVQYALFNEIVFS